MTVRSFFKRWQLLVVGLVVALTAYACMTTGVYPQYNEAIHRADIQFISHSDPHFVWHLGGCIRRYHPCTSAERNFYVPRYGYLDWTTDNCSAALDAAFWFDFTESCQVHDFAYRNTKHLETRTGKDYFNEGSRKNIDDEFQSNMRISCGGRGWPNTDACYITAQGYYNYVRLFGGGPAMTPIIIFNAIWPF